MNENVVSASLEGCEKIDSPVNETHFVYTIYGTCELSNVKSRQIFFENSFLNQKRHQITTC
jgi:hypothetical protein